MGFKPYKINEILENKYYQIPQELFVSFLYKDKLNSDSKILYAFLLDRLNLSQKNHWIDEETYIDLIKAITVMQRKHSKCRWKSERINSKKHYILIEGYYWLKNVYFQKAKKQIDRDINFFVERIYRFFDNSSIPVNHLVENFIKKYATQISGADIKELSEEIAILQKKQDKLLNLIEKKLILDVKTEIGR